MSEKAKVILFVVIALVIVACVSTLTSKGVDYVTGLPEVSSSSYNHVIRIVERCPRVRPLFLKAMEDDIIIRSEYDEIMDFEESLDFIDAKQGAVDSRDELLKKIT